MNLLAMRRKRKKEKKKNKKEKKRIYTFEKYSLVETLLFLSFLNVNIGFSDLVALEEINITNFGDDFMK